MTDRIVTLKHMRNTFFILALVIPAVLLPISMLTPVPMAGISLALVAFIGLAMLGTLTEFILLEVEDDAEK